MPTASPIAIPTPPSDALAAIAAAMLKAKGLNFPTLPKDISDRTYGSMWQHICAASTTDDGKLMENVTKLVSSFPPAPPVGNAQFIGYMFALEMLDRWHMPILPNNAQYPRSEMHNLALDNLYVIHRYNQNIDDGIVLPQQARHSQDNQANNDVISSQSLPGLVLSLLDYCSYIPADVMSGETDGPGGASAPKRIRLDYQKFSLAETGLKIFSDDVCLAIAPGVHDSEDAAVYTDNNSYTVLPKYNKQRLSQIIDEAISTDAHILLMPEMSVHGDNLEFFCRHFADARRRYYEERKNVPNLSMAVLGVIRPGPTKSALHRNYLAMIGQHGQILLEQEKLTHWNLNSRDKARFGLTDTAYSDVLMEHTVAGDKVTISEVEGLGRALGLICADMNHDMPSDWITDNIGLDILYAPIMDGSTCWTQGNAPWIINRAIRSCKRSGIAVVVTNSSVMTHWNNKVISRNLSSNPSYPYKVYKSCGIGLLVKHSLGVVNMQHIKSPLDDKYQLVTLAYWNRGWRDESDFAAG